MDRWPMPGTIFRARSNGPTPVAMDPTWAQKEMNIMPQAAKMTLTQVAFGAILKCPTPVAMDPTQAQMETNRMPQAVAMALTQHQMEIDIGPVPSAPD